MTRRPGPATREELEESWTLGPDELAMLAGKRGPTRLGFAVVLRFFAREGRFPEPAKEIDGEAVSHVALQVGVPPEGYGAYDLRGRTAEYHRAQVREAFGFRPATVEDADALAEWLLEEAAARVRPGALKEAAYARLRALKVEPPTPGRVERAARSALRRYDERFREQTLSRLPPKALAELDALLLGPDDALSGAPAVPDGAGEPPSREAEDAPCPGCAPTPVGRAWRAPSPRSRSSPASGPWGCPKPVHGRAAQGGPGLPQARGRRAAERFARPRPSSEVRAAGRPLPRAPPGSDRRAGGPTYPHRPQDRRQGRVQGRAGDGPGLQARPRQAGGGR